MREEEPKLRFGEYFDTPINEIPLDYLFWLFPKVKREPRLYVSILKFFLEKNIEVRDYTQEGSGYCFYFDEFKKFEPGTEEEIPFMISYWKGKDSKGNDLYEITYGEKDRVFIYQQVPKKWAINLNIIYHYYKFGGSPMILEKTLDYHFYDGYGKNYNGYLIRKPWIPDEAVIEKFSENIKN